MSVCSGLSGKDLHSTALPPSHVGGGAHGTALTIDDRIRMERMARALAKECAKKVRVGLNRAARRRQHNYSASTIVDGCVCMELMEFTTAYI